MNVDFPLQIERRAFQRSMSVSVRPNGVVKVTCGKGVSQYCLAQFLYQHRTWIEQCLSEQAGLRDKYPQKTFCEGELFLFLGEPRALKYQSSHRPGYFKNLSFAVTETNLLAWVPESFSLEPNSVEWRVQWSQALRDFYKKSAQKWMGQRVELFSNQMGLFAKSVSYRSQKTRWGSCSSEGNVSLNWRLMAAPPEVIDYVIVHELAHLRYQNHSKCFWKLVEQNCFDFKNQRRWLREHVMEFDFLAKKSELHLSESI